MSPASIYATTITHVRTTPLRNVFRYRSHWWLVDVDDLPRLPRPLRPLARFEARDHAGDPDGTLRGNLDAFLAEQGVDLGGGRVRLLTSARSLGHVFNPLSVWWCHDATGDLVCVVAEVHNPYGGRHRYLVRTDERGRASTDKAFYVSPFYPVDGSYTMSLPEPDGALAISVTLHRPEGRPFVASVTGRRHAATPLRVLATSLRRPAETLRVALLIRVQGVGLWLRRLPVSPRPADLRSVS